MDSYRNWQDLLDDEPEEQTSPEGQVLTEADEIAEAGDESVGAPKISKDTIPLPKELLELQAERDRLERHLKALTGQGEPDPDAARQAAMYPMPVFTPDTRIEERRGRRADETQRVTKQRRQERILLEKAAFERTLELVQENIAARRRQMLIDERKQEAEAFEEETDKRYQLARKVHARARMRLRLERQRAEAMLSQWANQRRFALGWSHRKSQEQQQDTHRVDSARALARRKEEEAKRLDRRRTGDLLNGSEFQAKPKDSDSRRRLERLQEKPRRAPMQLSGRIEKNDLRMAQRTEPDELARSMKIARKEPERRIPEMRDEFDRPLPSERKGEKEISKFEDREPIRSEQRSSNQDDCDDTRPERLKAVAKERKPERPKAIETKSEPERMVRPQAVQDNPHVRLLNDEPKRPESAHARAKAEEEREQQRREKLMLRRKSEREEEERLNRRHSSRQRDHYG